VRDVFLASSRSLEALQEALEELSNYAGDSGGDAKGRRKRREEMKDLLKDFVGKTLRIYTYSGVDSYLGVVEMIKDDYLVLKGYFKEDRTYLTLSAIESFKEEDKGK
jgi:hypothetical protein